jgi:hypothetical protein
VSLLRAGDVREHLASCRSGAGGAGGLDRRHDDRPLPTPLLPLSISVNIAAASCYCWSPSRHDALKIATFPTCCSRRCSGWLEVSATRHPCADAGEVIARSATSWSLATWWWGRWCSS